MGARLKRFECRPPRPRFVFAESRQGYQQELGVVHDRPRRQIEIVERNNLLEEMLEWRSRDAELKLCPAAPPLCNALYPAALPWPT